MVLHKSCTTRRCISECKVCGKRFEASVVALRIQEACSCTHGKKPLPESINGFRVIKEVEKDGCRRRYARAVCKKCDFEFTARTDIISKMKSCRCYENYPPRLVELSHSMRQRCKPENSGPWKTVMMTVRPLTGLMWTRDTAPTTVGGLQCRSRPKIILALY